MGQTQQIKGEIQEIQKLKDIAEIMSALAAANLALYKRAKKSFGIEFQSSVNKQGERSLHLKNDFGSLDEMSRIFNPQYTSFITLYDIGEAYPLDQENAINIFIGSDMGFCGKFNKGIKEVARLNKSSVSINECTIGKQLTGLHSTPIPLPDMRVSGNPAEKDNQVKQKLQEFAEALFQSEQGILHTNVKTIRIIFNVLIESQVNVFQCDVNIEDVFQSLKGSDGANQSAAQVHALYEHLFLDLYKSKEEQSAFSYLILDPRIQDVLEMIAKVKLQILTSLLSTIIIESFIAENHVRSSSMETTKDEAQQIILQLNKKLAKERQAKITGELIELITSFTSLNDAA